MEMEMGMEMFYAHNLRSTLSSEQISPCPAPMSYQDPGVRNPSPPLRSIPGLHGNLLPQQCPEMFPDPTVSRVRGWCSCQSSLGAVIRFFFRRWHQELQIPTWKPRSWFQCQERIP